MDIPELLVYLIVGVAALDLFALALAWRDRSR
jgi:hypothetical protein